MKKVLITGKNSYVGNAVEAHLLQYPDAYQVDKISLRTNEWQSMDFSIYDVVFHVAGIVHKKNKEVNRKTYFDINTDLTFKIAEKAKQDGVKQFVFLSTLNVYGKTHGIITDATVKDPSTNYGESKLAAEKKLATLKASNYIITVLRPPVIYGPNAKGNYDLLRKIAIKSPVFPNKDNSRDMCYIDNFCIYMEWVIRKNKEGIFYPKDPEPMKLTELVEKISNINNKKIFISKIFNPLIYMVPRKKRHKAFANLIIDITAPKLDVNLKNNNETINATEHNYD